MGLFSWLFKKRKKYDNYESYAGYGADEQYDFKSAFEEKDAQEEFLKNESELAPKKRATKKPAQEKIELEQKAENESTEKKPQEAKASTEETKTEKTVKSEKTTKTKKTVKSENTAMTEKAANNAKRKKGEDVKKAGEKLAQKKAVAVDDEIEDDSPTVKEAVAVQESKSTVNGKFDIRRAKDGRYFFSLYASNHMVIAYSQIYSSTNSVTTGINSVIANASKAPTEDTTLKNPTSLPYPKWEIYIDKAGQYRFRLYASNGLCVCHASHGYQTKSGAKGGIESIKRFCAEARVDKSYLEK